MQVGPSNSKQKVEPSEKLNEQNNEQNVENRAPIHSTAQSIYGFAARLFEGAANYLYLDSNSNHQTSEEDSPLTSTTSAEVRTSLTTGEMLTNSLPSIAGSLTEQVLNAYPKVVSKVVPSKAVPSIPKIVADGVKGVVAQQLSPSEQEMRSQAYTKVVDAIKQEQQKHEKELNQYVEQFTVLAKEAGSEMQDVSERLKRVFLEQLPTKKAFPFDYVKLIYQKAGSFMGYEFPKEFGQTEYEQWCQELDQIVLNKQNDFKSSTEIYQNKTTSSWLQRKQEMSNLVAPQQTQPSSAFKENKLVEVLKEVVRGTSISTLEVLTNTVALDKLKTKGPMPFIMGMAILNAFLAGIEVKTHSSAKIMEIKKEEKAITILNNESLEFMRRLVNSFGVAGVGLIASLTIGSKAKIATFLITGVATAIATGIMETINSTSSTPSDTDKAVKDLQKFIAEQIVSTNPQLFTLSESKGKFQNEIREAFLTYIDENTVNEQLAKILKEKLDELIPPDEINIEQLTKKIQEKESVSHPSNPSNNDDLQKQVMYFAFECMLILIFRSLPTRKKAQVDEQSFKTEQPAKTTDSQQNSEVMESLPLASNDNNLKASTIREKLPWEEEKIEQEERKKAFQSLKTFSDYPMGKEKMSPVSSLNESIEQLLIQEGREAQTRQKANYQKMVKQLTIAADEVMAGDFEIDTSEFSPHSDHEISANFRTFQIQSQSINQLFSGIEISFLSTKQRMRLEKMKQTYLNRISANRKQFISDIKRDNLRKEVADTKKIFQDRVVLDTPRPDNKRVTQKARAIEVEDQMRNLRIARNEQTRMVKPKRQPRPIKPRHPNISNVSRTRPIPRLKIF